MLKFSKIILLSFLLILGACCTFFLTSERQVPIELVEAEESIEYDTTETIGIDCLMAEDEDANYSPDENYFSFFNDYYKSSTLIIDTVFLNFSDCAMFGTSNYEFYMMQLESVSNYFEKVSRGNFQVFFNVNVCNLDESISLYKGVKTNIWSDKILYDKAYEQSVPISENFGEAQVKFMLLSANFNITCDIMFWPHAYPTSKFMVMHHNTADFIVCHELFHTLGLLDLYIGNDNIAKAIKSEKDFFRPVESEDIMATCQSTNIPTSAHNRYLLGWLEQSDFPDSVNTAIEKITESNTYVINEAMQQDGTIAYKFGVNSHEFFMIECRNFNGKNYIIVQRIHDVLTSNINAENQSQC